MTTRILIIPEPHSSQWLTGCSNINMLLDFGAALMRSDPAMHVTMVLPFCSLVEQEMLAMMAGQVELVYVGRREDWTPPGLNEPGIPPEVMEHVKGEMYDIVINRKMLHTAVLAHQIPPLPTRYSWHLATEVVSWFSETPADAAKPLLRLPPALALMTAMLETGTTVVTSDFDAQWVKANLVGGNVKLLKRLQESLHVVPAPVNYVTIREKQAEYTAQRLRRRADEDDVLTVMHGGTLQAKMRVGWMESAIDRVASLGKKVKFTVVTQNAVKVDEKRCRTKIIPNTPRLKWLEMLGDGDLFWCGSDYEATGLAFVEAVMSGMLPIVRDAGWLEERLPPGYPLKVKTEEALPQVLLYATDEYDKLRERWLGPLQLVVSRHGADRTALKALDWLRPLANQIKTRRLTTLSKTIEWQLLNEVHKSTVWREVEHREVTEAMAKVSKTGEFQSKAPLPVWRELMRAFCYEEVPKASPGERLMWRRV